MSLFTSIDLSKLPPPNLVEELDYEVILSATKNELQQIAPELRVDQLQVSDPASKLLEVMAYREMHLRARINDAARGVMLATATGSNLDHLAALVNVERLMIEPGDPDNAPVYEDDERLRNRTQLAFEGYSTAGPVGAYIFFAQSASAEVKDVAVFSESPGVVDVRILSNQGNGMASSELLGKVHQALNADNVRPVTDFVRVQSADIVSYNIKTTLTLFPGIGGQQVLDSARQAAAQFIQTHHQLGLDITRAGLFSALHQPGVQNISLHEPGEDILVPRSAAPFGELVSIELVEHPTSVPLNLPADIGFESEGQPLAGHVRGILTVSAADEEQDISHYVLYWGENNAQKLPSGPKVYQFSDDRLFLEHGSLADLVITNLDGSTIEVYSPRVRNLAITSLDGSVSYVQNHDYRQEGGVVTALNATLKDSKVRVTYELEPLARLPKGAPLTFSFEAHTKTPAGATHFLAFTENEFGEMPFGVSTAILQPGQAV